MPLRIKLFIWFASSDGAVVFKFFLLFKDNAGHGYNKDIEKKKGLLILFVLGTVYL